MRISYSDELNRSYAIEFDLKDAKKELEDFFIKIKTCIQHNIKKKYKVAFIDDRYYITGYINRYLILNISLNI